MRYRKPETTSLHSILHAIAITCYDRVLSLGLAASANAALSVQDSFTTGGGPVNYDDAAALTGQGPTGTTGYTGNWVASTGGGVVSTTGLSSSVSGYVGSSGGSITRASGVNVRTGRGLTTGFDGTSTGTVYLSFLMNLEANAGNTGYRAFEAHTSSLVNDAVLNWKLGIHNDGAFGTLAGSEQRNTIGFALGGSVLQLGDMSTTTGTNLFLIKFDLSATAASELRNCVAEPHSDCFWGSYEARLLLGKMLHSVTFPMEPSAMAPSELTKFVLARISLKSQVFQNPPPLPFSASVD